MTLQTVLIFAGLFLVAVFFSSVHSDTQGVKPAKISLVLGFSKMLSEVAIGLIIAAVPTMLLLNYLKPQPEDVMPVFISSGVYADVDVSDPAVIEELVDECTVAISKDQDAENYFNRASLYFCTDNLDLAYSDLHRCIELDENWVYYYDLGVVSGYLLDYATAIEYFEIALALDIPISERGLVRNTLTMIEGYYGTWLHSLLK